MEEPEDPLKPISTAMLMLVDNLTHQERKHVVQIVFPTLTTFTADELHRINGLFHGLHAFVGEALSVCDGSSGLGSLPAQRVNSHLKGMQSSLEALRYSITKMGN